MSNSHSLKPFGELLKAAIESYRANIKPLLLLAAIIFVIYVVFLLGLGGPQRAGDLDVSAADAGRGAILGLLYIAISIWVSVAMLMLAHRPKLGEDLPGLLRESASKFLPVLWASLIAGVLILLGLIVFIIPGIVVALWFAFATQVVVFTEQRGFNALQYSRSLVRGRWWALLGRFLLLMLVLLGASLVVSLVAGILTIPAPGLAQTLTDAFSLLVAAPVVTLFSYFLYQSAEATKLPESN